jgi:signal transduction histidine kinase
MGWASFRYRLMDIRVAVTRFGIFAIVYAIVLGIPFWIGYKYHLWYYSTAIMGVLATLGPFIYLRLEKRSKEILYKTEFKRYETLRRFSKTLLLIKELDKLVELIVYRLVKTLKVTYAAIYLYNKEIDAYELKSYRPLKYPNLPNKKTLSKEGMLIKLLFLWRKELVREEVANLPISRRPDNKNHIDLGLVQYEMRELSATLVIPHFLENELLGFLILGDKEKGAVYTEEDISILSALSNSAALAIENALFLIDLKITQAELFNAKRIAELGYMASAMGHEINNRLQAIYSVALDLTDNPLIYDHVKSSPDSKAAFDKDIAFINENVEDATKIINELKTYARPQDAEKQKFILINLKEVIDKAVSIVRLQSVKAFDMIDLDIQIPAVIPNISGNFIQLQQVFVNMLNNAHDAIIQMKEYLTSASGAPPDKYKGSIKITLQESKNKLLVHIVDNGIGMTEEIKKRLFVPLYTSKASADRKANRDIKGGTGIGLYTIQTIIRGHDGTIEVAGTDRYKGADFVITLPVAKERELARKG